MRKRSITIRGHSTSVSLEDEFWDELRRMARDAGVPLARLVQRIDEDRRLDRGLSGALRLAVLEDLMKLRD